MAQAFQSNAFDNGAFEASSGGGATNYTLTCSAGSFAVSGVSANLYRNRKLTASAGSYAQTGVSANLLRSKRIVATAGSYTQTGVSANLYRNRTLTASAGAYSVAGQNAVLTYTPTATNYTLTAQAGSFAITGVSATLMRSKLITAQAGSYAASGVSAAIKLGKVLVAQPGSYAVTGQSAILTKSGGLSAYTLTCLAGSYTLGGDFVDDGYIEPGYSGNAVITITRPIAEVELSPRRKWYVKRNKQILIFDSAQEADSYLEAQKQADAAIEAAQKTSRRARKRLRERVYSALPQAEVVDVDLLASLANQYSVSVDMPRLIAQQSFEEIARIAMIVKDMQDEEDVELLLLA